APAVLLFPAALRGDGPAQRSGKIDFNRDVRPILSDTCFACHGPDKKKRKADLRLDIRDSTVEVNKIIVPGKSADIELIMRLLHSDVRKRMPPKSTGKTLTAAQVAVLRQWIDEGAAYAQHWAYVVPERPAL